MRRGIDNMFQENLNQFPQPAPDGRVLVEAQQVGVGLQKMQVGVHGLLFVHVDIAQALVGGQGPVALVGLEVAAVPRIVAHGFDLLHQAQGLTEAMRRAGGVHGHGKTAGSKLLVTLAQNFDAPFPRQIHLPTVPANQRYVRSGMLQHLGHQQPQAAVAN